MDQCSDCHADRLPSRRRAVAILIRLPIALAAGLSGVIVAWAENPPAVVTIIEFSDTGVSRGHVSIPKVIRSDAEWRKILMPEQFKVTRKKGTEAPFKNEYDEFTASGIYRCVCCRNALFSSSTKYNSHTGWPSFWAPIAPENIRTQPDTSYDMDRTEVLCRECDAHLGHVFGDGPRPTGLRYCMNSAALIFIPAPSVKG